MRGVGGGHRQQWEGGKLTVFMCVYIRIRIRNSFIARNVYTNKEFFLVEGATFGHDKQTTINTTERQQIM